MNNTTLRLPLNLVLAAAVLFAAVSVEARGKRPKPEVPAYMIGVFLTQDADGVEGSATVRPQARSGARLELETPVAETRLDLKKSGRAIFRSRVFGADGERSERIRMSGRWTVRDGVVELRFQGRFQQKRRGDSSERDGGQISGSDTIRNDGGDLYWTWSGTREVDGTPSEFSIRFLIPIPVE